MVDLTKIAKSKGLSGYSKLNKAELIKLLRRKTSPKKCVERSLTIGNNQKYITVISTGYEERLTKQQLPLRQYEISGRKYSFKDLEHILLDFSDTRLDNGEGCFIGLKSGSILEDYTLNKNTLSHDIIRQDLTDMREAKRFDSYVCAGFVTIAEAINITNKLITPDRCIHFWTTVGFANVALKKAPSGRSYVLITLDTESG